MAITASQPKMTAQDRKWQAESDARTLAESQVIMKDPKRLAAAAKEAQVMADKQAKEAKAMAKVAAKAPDMSQAKPVVRKPTKSKKGVK
jgi:hypothetical protein